MLSMHHIHHVQLVFCVRTLLQDSRWLVQNQLRLRCPKNSESRPPAPLPSPGIDPSSDTSRLPLRVWTDARIRQCYCIFLTVLTCLFLCVILNSGLRRRHINSSSQILTTASFLLFICSKIWVKITQLVYKRPELFISDLSWPLRWLRSGLFLSPESKLNTGKQSSGFIHHTSGTNSQKTSNLL